MILKSYDVSIALTSPKEIKEIKEMLPSTMEIVALVEVIITNRSLLPIIVLEFQIEGAIAFNSYSYINNSLKVSPGN